MATNEALDLALTPAAFRAAHALLLAAKSNRNAGYSENDAADRAVAQWADFHDDAVLALQARQASLPTDASTFGAVGDNATDNSVALQAGIDAASATGGVLEVPAGTYRFATPLTNPTCVPIVCVGELVFTGSGAHALTFGTSLSSTVATRTVESVIRIRRLTTNWSSSHAGVALVNVNELPIAVQVYGFECGVLLRGVGFGCAYNRVRIQRIYDCRAAVRFHAGASGWSNQNLVIGGRISTLQATNSALNLYGLHFVCDSALSRPNGNVVWGTSIELHNAGAGWTSAVHGEYTTGTIAAQYNAFRDLRIESTDYWLSGAGIIHNVLSLTYQGAVLSLPATVLQPATAADLLTLVQNRFETNVQGFGAQEPRVVTGWNRSNVVAVSTNVWRPARGLGWSISGSGDFVDAVAGTIADTAVTLSSTNGLGVLIDLSNLTHDYARLLTVKLNVAATGGRVFAVLWDASFARLDTSTEHCSLTWSGTQGYYRTGSDLTADASEVQIAFGSSVRYAFIGIAAGTSSAQVRSMDVLALGAHDIRAATGVALVNSLSPTTPNLGIRDSGDPIANASPLVPGAATDYPVGLLVRNVLATAGQPLGWQWDGTRWRTVDGADGPALQSSDFALGNGTGSFGTTASVSVKAGSTSKRWRITITTGGAGIAAGTATVTLTFPEGAYPSAPFGSTPRQNGGTMTTNNVFWTETTTTIVLTLTLAGTLTSTVLEGGLEPAR